MTVIISAALLGVVFMFIGFLIDGVRTVRWMAVLGILVLAGFAIYDYVIAQETAIFRWNDMLMFNETGSWFNLMLVGCTMFYFLLFNRYIVRVGRHSAEYFALIFFILCGIFMLSSYAHLLILFLGIEIISIPQYILAGSDKENLKSNEAALKYFLLGAFSTGILLMGITLIYGATGSFYIQHIAEVLKEGPHAMVVIGILLLMISFGFKVSAAPMHWWTADVYDGTPTAITPFMATITKVGAFVAFMRLFHFAFGYLHYSWSIIAAVLIVLTLFIGNITAVYQQSVKRMLAYSSIAQAGFMLFSVFAVNEMAEKALVYYLVAYTLASLGIFSVMIKLKDYTYDGFNGLGKSHPVLAMVACVSILSLAGIPITSGFFAKYFVLQSVVSQGQWIGLVVYALLMAAISIYYYFKVIRAMYFREGDPEFVEDVSSFDEALLIVVAILIVLMGIFPHWILQ